MPLDITVQAGVIGGFGGICVESKHLEDGISGISCWGIWNQTNLEGLSTVMCEKFYQEARKKRT